MRLTSHFEAFDAGQAGFREAPHMVLSARGGNFIPSSQTLAKGP